MGFAVKCDVGQCMDFSSLGGITLGWIEDMEYEPTGAGNFFPRSPDMVVGFVGGFVGGLWELGAVFVRMESRLGE